MNSKLSDADILRDPRWLDKAGRIKTRDGHKCVSCGCTASESRINVYHIVARDLERWEYPDEYLRSMCPDCFLRRQRRMRDLIDDLRKAFADLSLSEFFTACERVGKVVEK